MKRKWLTRLVILFFVILFSPSLSPAGDFFWSPSECIWATAPALYGYPIDKDDLRKCINDLIGEIRENRDRIKDLEEQLKEIDNKLYRIGR